MALFNEAERRIKEGGANGNNNPYQILWEIARERNPGQFKDSGTGIQNTGARAASSNSSTTNGYLQGDRESIGTKDIQLQSDTDSAKGKRKYKASWADFS